MVISHSGKGVKVTRDSPRFKRSTRQLRPPVTSPLWCQTADIAAGKFTAHFSPDCHSKVEKNSGIKQYRRDDMGEKFPTKILTRYSSPIGLRFIRCTYTSFHPASSLQHKVVDQVAPNRFVSHKKIDAGIYIRIFEVFMYSCRDYFNFLFLD